ncbi:hypothetical protein CB1_060782099 [Camelus ferus]|nr:hypothetical protein CB1_060782099 [Camelus ferus]
MPADGAVRATVEEEEEEVVKDRTQQSRPQPPQPSTGPASRAARGSSASIPFIDCSDVDSESDLLREHASQSRSQTNDNYEGDLTSGVYLLSREERRIEARHRASPHSVKSSRPPSREFLDNDSADISFDTPTAQAAHASRLGDQLAPLQVTEGSTSSGTESSDSDSEMVTPLNQPLVFGNPAVLGSPSVERNKKSLSGLRVKKEREENE